MIKLEAVPTEYVDKIRFGMKRNNVRAVLGEPKEFKKTATSKMLTDDFGFCHVFYNSNEECEAVEIFSDTEVYIDGSLIFPTNLKKAKEIIEDFKRDEYGLISKKMSVGIYAPNNKMESILFGEKGYYSS